MANFGELLDKMHLAEQTLANLWFPWIENVNITVVYCRFRYLDILARLKKVASVMSSCYTFSIDPVVLS